MKNLQDLRNAFIAVRRHFKAATKADKSWGDNVRLATIAWDNFQALFDALYTDLTGMGIEKRVIKRRRLNAINHMERNCLNDRGASENSQKMEQGLTIIL